MDGNLPVTNVAPPTLQQLISSLKQDDAATNLPVVWAAVRTPANGEWLGGRIKTLLSHFFQPDMDTRVLREVANDWITALKNFPQFAVEAAVTEYLETGTHRPAPGHIANLARKHLDRVKALASDKSKPVLYRDAPRKVSDESRERANNILKEAGFQPRKFGA